MCASRYGIVIQPFIYAFFIYPSLASSAKSLFLFSLTNLSLFISYNPPNNFSSQMLVGRSCIFWGFFSCFSIRNCQPAFCLSVTGFCKKFFLAFLTNSKFSVSVCSFLGCPSVKIKSDDRYQIGQGISSDNHRPILYHVISFIQWEHAEIIRWVITSYSVNAIGRNCRIPSPFFFSALGNFEMKWQHSV